MAVVNIKIEESLLDALVVALEALQLQKRSGYKKRATPTDEDARKLFHSEYSARELARMYGRNQHYFTRYWENLGLDVEGRASRHRKAKVEEAAAAETGEVKPKKAGPVDLEMLAITSQYGSGSEWTKVPAARDAVSALLRKRQEQNQ